MQLTIGLSVLIGAGMLALRQPLLSLFGVSQAVRDDALAVLAICALEMVLHNIPSILVKAGDVVSVAEGSRNSDKIKLVTEANASRPVPQWLDADKNQLTAKVVRLPAREDVDMDIEEQQIVEFYSK